MLLTKQLTKTFGSEIQNIQITADMDEIVFQEIINVWNKSGIILFRNQKLSESDLVTFSRRIGKLEEHVRTEWLSDSNPEILVLSNIKKGGKMIGGLSNSEINWHYDQIYLPKPALGSLLTSVIIPPEGGSTYFADMCSVYNKLPDALRQKILKLKAIQSYENFNQGHTIKTKSAIKNKTPDVTHPIVRTHPVTGKKALYICPGMTTSIVGLSKTESDLLLKELFAFSIQPDFVYRHNWKVGDAILWDNACTMHRRDDFNNKYDRLMKRTTILPPDSVAVPI